MVGVAALRRGHLVERADDLVGQLELLDGERPAQLRGMSPDQVLVLINGKRRHTTSVTGIDTKIGRGTAPVDFNSIPSNAIKRIEVLRDGAGAQYGSDAIAGVVNVILKKSHTGTTLHAEVGGSQRGGGRSLHVSGIRGFGDFAKPTQDSFATESRFWLLHIHAHERVCEASK